MIGLDLFDVEIGRPHRTQIFIEDSGLAFWRLAAGRGRTLEAQALVGLTDTERHALIELLGRVKGNLDTAP